MCKKKEKLTAEQEEARKVARHDRRSEFLSRMVDEFKKVGFIATVVFCMSIIIWCMVLYTKSIVDSSSQIIASVASGLQIVASVAFGIIGTAFTAYCAASTSAKKSLNDNNMVKNKDGTFSKIVSTVVNAVTNATAKNDESDDGEAKG